METFAPLAEVLGPRRLSEAFRSCRQAGLGYAARALFDGCISVCRWPRAAVVDLLPPELALASDEDGDGWHPLLVVFGRQRETAWTFGGLVAPVGEDYEELLLAVPFVRLRGTRELATYVPGMRSSDLSSTWVGAQLYGLGKEIACVEHRGPLSIWTAADGRLVFHALLGPAADDVAAQVDTGAALGTLRQVAALPVVGKRYDGSFVGCYFDWDFREARARPVSCSMSFDEPLGARGPVGAARGVPGATLWVEGMIWRLSWPFRCRS